MIDYEYILKKFNEYCNNIKNKNSDYYLKLNHSYHVADLFYKLAKIMNLNDEDCTLFRVIGLLHDIGRFKQIEIANMIDDYQTGIDHAKLGCDYLFKENHIIDFKIPEKYYNIIEVSILNHNKLKILKNITDKKERMFCKLIRDVDKIDIFRVLASFENKIADAPSKNVLKKFKSKESIAHKDIKNSTDDLLKKIAFVFDINYKESYELLNETDNLELFLSTIEVDKSYEEEYHKLKEEVRTYLRERIDD